MIYALVEPSIYMIASILPTTRHLYRRVHRNAQRAAQLRSAKSDDDGPKSDSALSQPAELDLIKNDDANNGRIAKHLNTWPTDTNSSQEGLTLEDEYENQQEWNQSRPDDDPSSNTSKKRSSGRPRIRVRQSPQGPG